MKKSIKTKLVKIITKDFLKENLFSSIDTLKPNLQKELDDYLKFETRIENIEKIDNETYFQIFFIDDNNVTRVIDITSTSKTVLLD